MKKIILISLISFAALMSCRNSSWDFPDYDYSSVYFAYQYPVRTIVLGEDTGFDTSLDNEHKCKIMATSGGAYENKTISIDFKVENSLSDNILFEKGGAQVVAMPAEYYQLASNRIVIPKGKVMGGVEVQLTDAFFADPLALKNTYVIPLRMTNVENADTILQGLPDPLKVNHNEHDPTDWKYRPKDYILYAVKYINPWHGNYLRRGIDEVKGNNGNTALDRTIIRHKKYVEDDEICNMITHSLKKVELPLSIKNAGGQSVKCSIFLTFDDEGSCTVSSESPDYTASGGGSFVKRGEKKSWGNKDRDAVYLKYKIDFTDVSYSTVDTLVVRDRGVKHETFIPVLF